MCEYKREGERFRLSCLLTDREAGVDTLGNCFLYPGGLNLNEPGIHYDMYLERVEGMHIYQQEDKSINEYFVCMPYTYTWGKNQTSDICSLWWILRIPCFAKEAKCIIACTVYSISYDVAELTFAGRNEVVYSKALLSPVLRASISGSKHTQ